MIHAQHEQVQPHHPRSRPALRRGLSGHQRGASSVESLILLSVVALALAAAAIGLQRAYSDIVEREGVAVATFDFDGWGAPEPPPPLPPPPARPPRESHGAPFWKTAVNFAIDLTPIGDIKTLMDPNASGVDKALAVVGLGTLFLPGVGSAVKVASAGAKAAKAAKAARAASKAEHAAKDAGNAAKGAEDAQHAAKGAGEADDAARSGDEAAKNADESEDAAAAGKRRKNEPEAEAPKRMKMHDDCFKRNPAHDVSEFEDQLLSQAEGLNELTVEQYLKNRDLFKNSGRLPDPTQRQQRDQVRRELEDDLYQHLLGGIDNPTEQQQRDARTQAQRKIANTMRSLAALHNADQVAGGGLGAEGVGDSRINSSLGSQWTQASPGSPGMSRAEALEAAARAVPESERGSTLLNVELYEC